MGGTSTARLGLSHATIYPCRPFKCQDGTIIVAIQNGAAWVRFCEDAFGVPALAHDPRYDARAKCVAANIAWARYSEVPDLSAHPALRRVDVTLTTGETDAIPRPAGRERLDTMPLPGLGQHTDAIRREFS